MLIISRFWPAYKGRQRAVSLLETLANKFAVLAGTKVREIHSPFLGEGIPMKKEYMIPQECADYLKMSKGHLSVLTRWDKIPHVRIAPKLIRYDREAIDAWLAAGGTSSRESRLTEVCA